MTGFIRFTAGWYMIVISKRSVVALIGGHYIYHIEDTSMYSVTYNQKVENPTEEQRSVSPIISPHSSLTQILQVDDGFPSSRHVPEFLLQLHLRPHFHAPT